MARIRTVKPEYPQHRKTRKVSRDARLLNIHLWNLADDEGRLQELVPWIIGAVFPGDEDVSPAVLRGWLDELAAVCLIVRYEVDGEHYIQCHDWHDHQNINRPQGSTLPPFQAGSGALTEPSVNDHGEPTKGSLGEGKGRERKGREQQRARASERDKSILAILDDLAFRRNLPQLAVPAALEVNAHFGSFASEAEAKKFRHYYTETEKGKRAAMSDVVWAWRGWLGKVKTPAPPEQPKPADRSAYEKVEAAT